MRGVQLFGFKKIYGLLMTFNQFQLVCTDDIDEESDNMDNMIKALKCACERARIEALE